MYIYTSYEIPNKKIHQAQSILNKLNYKHCFISGSFLYKNNYKDIDVFIISRSKKLLHNEKVVTYNKIDFNQLHSLFYHSIKKNCITKNILPQKTLKTTVKEYWETICETVPMILNDKKNFRKYLRLYVLYTEYLDKDIILDTHNLYKQISAIKDYKHALKLIQEQTPELINKYAKKTYIKRIFYTYSAFYRESSEYESCMFLKNLAIAIIHDQQRKISKKC